MYIRKVINKTVKLILPWPRKQNLPGHAFCLITLVLGIVQWANLTHFEA